jgi:hypothetical protein
MKVGRIDIILVTVGTAIGAAVAAGYGAWHATSREGLSVSGRWSAFGEAMLFPGWLIIAAIAAMVWMGWRANIDQS